MLRAKSMCTPLLIVRCGRVRTKRMRARGPLGTGTAMAHPLSIYTATTFLTNRTIHTLPCRRMANWRSHCVRWDPTHRHDTDSVAKETELMQDETETNDHNNYHGTGAICGKGRQVIPIQTRDQTKPKQAQVIAHKHDTS